MIVIPADFVNRCKGLKFFKATVLIYNLNHSVRLYTISANIAGGNLPVKQNLLSL